jgi:hypothetical protein
MEKQISTTSKGTSGLLRQLLARHADGLSPRSLHLRLQSSHALQMPVANAVQLNGQHQRQTLDMETKERAKDESEREMSG